MVFSEMSGTGGNNTYQVLGQAAETKAARLDESSDTQGRRSKGFSFFATTASQLMSPSLPVIHPNHPNTPPSLQSTASAEMPKMMFRKRFEGMGLFGVPPTPTYSFSTDTIKKKVSVSYGQSVGGMW